MKHTAQCNRNIAPKQVFDYILGVFLVLCQLGAVFPGPRPSLPRSPDVFSYDGGGIPSVGTWPHREVGGTRVEVPTQWAPLRSEATAPPLGPVGAALPSCSIPGSQQEVCNILCVTLLFIIPHTALFINSNALFINSNFNFAL